MDQEVTGSINAILEKKYNGPYSSSDGRPEGRPDVRP